MSDDTLLELNFSTKTKTEFNTIEELQSAYPIGYIISSVAIKKARNKPYYNNIDLESLYKKYGKNNVQILDECYVKCSYIDTIEKKVEGYIFDGEYWRPAYSTWDGWIPYLKEDFEEL